MLLMLLLLRFLHHRRLDPRPLRLLPLLLGNKGDLGYLQAYDTREALDRVFHAHKTVDGNQRDEEILCDFQSCLIQFFQASENAVLTNKNVPIDLFGSIDFACFSPLERQR
jgi:hypothetical protein